VKRILYLLPFLGFLERRWIMESGEEEGAKIVDEKRRSHNSVFVKYAKKEVKVQKVKPEPLSSDMLEACCSFWPAVLKVGKDVCSWTPETREYGYLDPGVGDIPKGKVIYSIDKRQCTVVYIHLWKKDSDQWFRKKASVSVSHRYENNEGTLVISGDDIFSNYVSAQVHLDLSEVMMLTSLLLEGEISFRLIDDGGRRYIRKLSIREN
jgi:hypothetical protein